MIKVLSVVFGNPKNKMVLTYCTQNKKYQMTCLKFWALVLIEMEELSTVAVLENVVLVVFVICALPHEAHVEKGCV